MVAVLHDRQYRALPRWGVLIVIMILHPARLSASESAISAGQQAFERDCALCHGVDARGGGAFAELLNVKPPDLTLLARQQSGDFPFTRVYARIDGRGQPLAHGTPQMPLWGERWRNEGGSETYVRGRLLEILLYLESIQEP